MKPEPSIGKYVDDEEKALFELIESDDYKLGKSHLTPARKRQLEASARATLHVDHQRISLWISHTDLARIKSKAMQEGMPYQTLIGSILNKGVS